jgi:PAS domain S-box-containing protein
MANAAATELRGANCGSCRPCGLAVSDSSPCLLDEILRSGEPVSTDHVISSSSGPIAYALNCFPLTGESGETTHVVHYLSSPSETNARHELGETTELLARLTEETERAQRYLDIASVVLVSLDRDGNISLLNRKGCELLGCEEDSALSMSWFDLAVPERERDGVRRIFAQIMAGEAELFAYHENHILTASGEERLMAWNNVLLTDANGASIGTLSSGEDITDRRKAEEALCQSEAKFREFADHLPQVVFEANAVGKLTFVNAHGFEMFGYDHNDLAGGLSLFNVIRPDQISRAQTALGAVLAGNGNISGNEYVALKKDGTEFPMVVYSSPAITDDQVTGLRGIAVDISERKRLEQELRTREKSSAASQLADGIAHDVNNLLSPIVGGASLIRHVVDEVEAIPRTDRAEIIRLLAAMEEASTRLARLNMQLMHLSKGNPPVKTTASLADCVRETTELALSGSNVELAFSTSGEPLPSDIDRDQIDQVITNIVTNAKYAMSKGGTLHVSVDSLSVSDGSSLPLDPGKYARISFRDEGSGIPTSVLPHIFDPYFTTKGAEGTGLGLATSFNLINQHGGHIVAESEPGRGATFQIYLPMSSGTISASQQRTTPVIRGDGRILVMDDEDSVQKVADHMLTRMGYQCDVVSEGSAAVDLYREAMSTVPYSAVILDLTVFQKARLQ